MLMLGLDKTHTVLPFYSLFSKSVKKINGGPWSRGQRKADRFCFDNIERLRSEIKDRSINRKGKESKKRLSTVINPYFEDMNLAECSSALRLKDGEKTIALEDIKNAEALRSRGFIGKLVVTLVGVKGLDIQSCGENLNLKYTLSPPDFGEFAVADKAKSSSEGYLLISKDVVLSICLEIPGESAVADEVLPATTDDSEDMTEKNEGIVGTIPSVVAYYAEFDCKELPEEGYMQLELIGKNEGQVYKDLQFVIKVSYDKFTDLIARKMTELEQVRQQMNNLKKTIKDDDTSKSAPPKSGKAKKQKKKADSDNDVNTPKYTSETDNVGPSTLEHVEQFTVGAAFFVASNRAYFLFCAASFAIYYFGDQASI